MSKINLLQETLEKLQENGKEPENVLWVGSKNGEYAVEWSEFAQLADRDYDRDFNSQLVAKDLVVVGENWWLERKDYEGAEWWVFMSFPQKAEEATELQFIFADHVGENGWLSLKQIHESKI